jgi:hypothetical protein
MPIRTCLVSLAVAAALAIGCESRASLPASPSGADGSLTIAAGTPRQFAGVTEHGKSITLSDGCDPDTFNLQPPNGAGPGTCLRPGGVRFQSFLDEVRDHHSVGAWHMSPGQATIQLGDVLEALNQGGEVHTFTEVDHFGGGFFQPLNDLGGFGQPISECVQNPTLLHPGDKFHEITDQVGVEKYQCCIHPWMRAVIQIVPAH